MLSIALVIARVILACIMVAGICSTSCAKWNRSSKRPLGGLLFSNVFHSLAVASRTSNRRHASPTLPTEFRRPNGHVNDGFIDQHLFTAARTAIEELFRRWTKGFVRGFRQ